MKSLKGIVQNYFQYTILLPGLILYISYFSQQFLLSEMLISLLPLLIAAYLLDYVIVLLLIKPKKLTNILFMVLIIPFAIIMLSFYFQSNPQKIAINSTDNAALNILSFNIYYHNKELQALNDTVYQQQPDIIMLYELTNSQYTSLKELIGKDYPYSQSSPAGNGYFSKIKPQNASEHYSENALSFQKLTFEINSQPIDVYGIHPPAPVSESYLALRKPYLDLLINDLNNNQNEQIVIVGDFNMTPWVSAYTDFLEQNSHKFINVAQGQGIDFTWSFSDKTFMPITQIDHALLTPALQYDNYKSIRIAGSDHKAIYLTVK